MVKKIIYLIISILFVLPTICCDAQIDSSKQVLGTNISLDYQDIEFNQLLDSIHNKYAIDFSYDPSKFPSDSIVNITVKNESLSTILDKLLANYPHTLKTIERQVVITTGYRNTEVRDYISINGKVVSAANDKPVSLVNIALFGYPLGTITNIEGDFNFLIPRKYIGKQIYFSSIGYKSSIINVPHKDSTLYMLLTPETIELKEIEVKFIPVDEIIRNVIKKREENYLTYPTLLTAFFRESIQQDGTYIEVSEALLDIYKSSYLRNDDYEEVRFVKGRKKVEDKEVSVARLKLAGGPFLFANIDIAKHLDFFNVNSKSVLYSYEYRGKALEYGRVVYKIGFKPISNDDDLLYEGEFSIDIESFALVSATFRMTKSTLKNSAKYLIRKNAKKVKSIPVYTEYTVDYRPYKDKWILNKAIGKIKFRMTDKRNKRKSDYFVKSELLVSDIENGEGQRIKYSDSFKPNYLLSDQIVEFDKDFWQNYNVIQPDEDIEKVFSSHPVKINVVPEHKKTRP